MIRTITIRIEVPDGTSVRIGGPDDDVGDEPLPPPWQMAPDTPVTAVRILPAEHNGTTGGCPIHRRPWRTVPAGVSKRTGERYSSFVACPAPGCTERPTMRRTAS